ncbi:MULTISPECIES: Hpt domain-containing protein [unclassified Brevundimonas]|uniref:Hpt domain-containing protein n=1 Tax=unclassified Brevundimonas TaxID=2622653 RepID=UPI000CFC90A3|nr:MULTISPECIES: Hpt domain-containing protein [unclassified Brevundimonas]PRA21336.1 Hpt domain-containing protein [Brevundimonas sp. MYb27]PQZ73273.1 Hpt domain-containing protein [Brevundimonas sp. MYb31]PRB17525.1 Hpt domain-containing protein [Brevundimonas sp. MYb52]PRB37898.1 Hpt domain-containing protein [Brevundimonas sp. MYb46]PRB40640.1 Hpt domain-containing protein [Brevundimonas sp. MYb33]
MSNPPQVIRPPNPLRAKVGGFGGIDADAIAKAEAALKAMSAQFGQWLNDEIVKLDQAQADIRAKGYTPETAEALYFRAHDLKGLGATYQYPLVTRIAGSLCRMMDDADKRMQASVAILDAHIDAIRAVVRDEIQTDEHPVGRELAETLEARVAEHLA